MVIVASAGVGSKYSTSTCVYEKKQASILMMIVVEYRETLETPGGNLHLFAQKNISDNFALFRKAEIL